MGTKKGSKIKITEEGMKRKRRFMRERNLTDNPSWRPEVRKKMSDSHRGKKLSEEHRRKIGNATRGMPGRKWSFKDRKKVSMAQQKVSENEWSGFKSSMVERLKRTSAWKIWRELVFARDNYTCQNENCPYCHNVMGVNLHPHHIKFKSKNPELMFNVANGVTLCREYHYQLHRKIAKRQECE